VVARALLECFHWLLTAWPLLYSVGAVTLERYFVKFCGQNCPLSVVNSVVIYTHIKDY